MQRIWRLAATVAIAGLVLAGCKKPETAAATGKWGYIDKNGNFIIQPQFDEASNFSADGVAIVRDGKRLLKLKANPPGESGDPVKPEDSPALSPPPELRAANGANESYKIMDGEKCVFEPGKGEAPEALFHDNDYVCVRFNKQFVFLDKQGKMFLQPWDQARAFSEHRAAVMDGKKWGFVSRKGKFVVPPKFMAAGDYVNGLAPVEIPADPK